MGHLSYIALIILLALAVLFPFYFQNTFGYSKKLVYIIMRVTCIVLLSCDLSRIVFIIPSYLRFIGTLPSFILDVRGR